MNSRKRVKLVKVHACSHYHKHFIKLGIHDDFNQFFLLILKKIICLEHNILRYKINVWCGVLLKFLAIPKTGMLMSNKKLIRLPSLIWSHEKSIF